MGKWGLAIVGVRRLESMRHKSALAILLVLTTAVAAGCGSDPTATPTPEPTSTPTPEAMTGDPESSMMEESDGMMESESTVTTAIANFTLEDLTIKAGTTVVWKNLDSVPHTSTSGSSPTPDGSWDTDRLGRDQSAEGITFKDTGTFAYFCTVHPNMTATLTVT